MRFTKQPIFAVALALLAISAVVSWNNVPTAFGLFQWFGQVGPQNLVPLTLDILYRFASVFGALAVVVLGAVAKDVRSAKWAAFAVGIIGPFASIILGIYWITQGSSPKDAFFAPGGWALAADIAIWVELAAVVLFAIGLLISKEAPKTVAEVSVNRFDPATGQPIAAAPTAPVASDNLPLSNLPQLAFVFGIVAPLVGVIIGFVALNQMKTGLISRVNEKQARNGILIGFILIGVSIFVSIILVIVSVILAASAFNSYGY